MSNKYLIALFLLFILFHSESSRPQSRIFFIGDYGENSTGELMVANTMFSWFQGGYDTVFTLGDNNYPNGEATTIMENVGKYYSKLMYPFNQSGFANPYGYRGNPLNINYFFPCMGNHDWYANPIYGYLLFFGANIPNTSSGNDRYYYVNHGNVLFVVLDSWVGDNPPSWIRPEPDGINATSVQAMWVKGILQNSTAKWKVIIMHHPPYCSTQSTYVMRWTYKQWGADLVMAGHDHLYERLYVDSLYYTINGCGGGGLDIAYPTPIQGSQKLYIGFGFQMMTAYEDSLNLKFIAVDNTVKDNFTITKNYTPPPPIDTLTLSDSVRILWDREFNK